MATLKVVLVKCANLKDDDAGQGLSDPYVEFEVHGQREKSSVKQNNLNPVWHETFLFRDVPKHMHDLHVKVMDSDTVRDDKLGQCLLLLIVLCSVFGIFASGLV